MSRMVSRSRSTGGKGIGERLSEGLIYVVVISGIALAARWYFVVYRHSPTAALLSYLGSSKSGEVKTAYSLLSADTKRAFGSEDKYGDFPLAHGYTGSLIDYKIEKMTESTDKAEADVTTTVRKSGLEIYQSASDNFADHFVLRKEADGWKIDLKNSNLKSREHK